MASSNPAELAGNSSKKAIDWVTWAAKPFFGTPLRATMASVVALGVSPKLGGPTAEEIVDSFHGAGKFVKTHACDFADPEKGYWEDGCEGSFVNETVDAATFWTKDY